MAAASPSAAAPAATYPSRVIHHKAVVDQAKHKIDFGHGCVAHPYPTFRATNGPITVGEYCVFEDEAVVENVLPPHSDGTPRTLTIGDYNIFGCRSDVQAASVGSHNRLHPYASLGVMATLGSGCVLSASARVSHDVAAPDDTVVHGNGGKQDWKTRVPNRSAEEAEAINVTRWLRKNLKA